MDYSYGMDDDIVEELMYLRRSLDHKYQSHQDYLKELYLIQIHKERNINKYAQRVEQYEPLQKSIFEDE